MNDVQNIKISKDLFDKIHSFFSHLYFSRYEPPAMYDFHGIFDTLNKKLDRINLRSAYTRAAKAEDDEKRSRAFSDYIYLKNKEEDAY